MSTTEQMIRQAEREALRFKGVRDVDLVVIAANLPIAHEGNANMLKIHQVGSPR